jgi:hypothetical protein
MVDSSTESRFAYRLFGMQVDSNLALADLRKVEPPAARADLELWFLHQPPPAVLSRQKKLRYTSVDLNHFGVPVVQVWEVGEDILHVAYCDGTEFWFDREVTTLWVQWLKTSSFDSMLTYLLGPVFGLLLRLKGVLCLHASAVVVEGSAVVFAGREGSGKSTTAAEFAQQGYAVLSDDVVAITQCSPNNYEVIPAYPRLNLWPASVKLIYGDEDALPAIVENWDKKYLALGAQGSARFEDRPIPLGAVYVFDESVEASGLFTVKLSQRASLMAIVANTYAANLLDAEQRAQEFAFLSKLVERVPVRRLNPRRGEWSVAQLCKALRADLQTIGTCGSLLKLNGDDRLDSHDVG